MNNRDLVVRIVQPSEQPYLAPREAAPARAESRRAKMMRRLTSGLGVLGITAFGVLFAVLFFNSGFAVRDILVVISLPVVVGVVASYAIF
jgi:hypothetical protein